VITSFERITRARFLNCIGEIYIDAGNTEIVVVNLQIDVRLPRRWWRV